MWRHSSKINSMDHRETIASTWSLCPVCLKRVPAERVRQGRMIFLEKECPEHGAFSTVIWRGYYDFARRAASSGELFTAEPECPDRCGLCDDHQQKTCCTLLNVTDNCNLGCLFCLADQRNGSTDPPLERVKESLERLVVKGRTLVQLSGGEPATRDDLPDIVAAARKAGARYVQLNSNGIRLGEEPDYVKRLADAGLSFLFLQYDGTDDQINLKLRGRSLIEIKQQAISNCADHGIGVTLVQTLVRGVNLNNIGELIRYAVTASPAVRGIHFQPVSYFGRIPAMPDDNDRITMDELLCEIERQTGGMVGADYLRPSCCDHPLCKFHGDFVVTPDNNLMPLHKEPAAGIASCAVQPPGALSFAEPAPGKHPSADPASGNTSCAEPAATADMDNRRLQVAADRNREFIGRRWSRPQGAAEAVPPSGDMHDMDYFLWRAKNYGFTITSMMFQDAGNIDLDRLRKCGFHVWDNGRLIPFCANYLTPWQR